MPDLFDHEHAGTAPDPGAVGHELQGREAIKMPMAAPPGYRIDPFADARMGKSLFQMEPADWLVKEEAPPLRYRPDESRAAPGTWVVLNERGIAVDWGLTKDAARAGADRRNGVRTILTT